MQNTITYYVGKSGLPRQASLMVVAQQIALVDQKGQALFNVTPQQVTKVEFVADLPTFRVYLEGGQLFTLSTVNWGGSKAIMKLGVGLLGLAVTLAVYILARAVVGANYSIFALFIAGAVFCSTIVYILKGFSRSNPETAEGGVSTDQWQAQLTTVLGASKITSTGM